MYILIIYAIGVLCGFLITRHFCKKGLGKMKICMSCPYKVDYYNQPENNVSSRSDIVDENE